MEKMRWVELALIVLAAGFMLLAVVINGAKVQGNVISSSSGSGAERELSLYSFDYGFSGNSLVIDYSLKELGGRNQDVSVVYTLRDYDGNKVAEGTQAVVLGAGESGSYKAKLDVSPDVQGAFRLSFSVWNGKESQWIVRDIGKQGLSISGMAIAESTDKVGNGVLILLVLTFIVLMVVLYLRRHNARAVNLIRQKRRLIPFEFD